MIINKNKDKSKKEKLLNIGVCYSIGRESENHGKQKKKKKKTSTKPFQITKGVTVIPIQIGGLATVPKDFVGELEKLKIRRRIETIYSTS